jgi:hypothetical protein
MKLVCINNTDYEDRLTVGKTYQFDKMTDGDDSAYLWQDDNGHNWPFMFDNIPSDTIISKGRWISLEEFREGQLNKLGI